MSHSKNVKKGYTLTDIKEHHYDHMHWSRRDFMQTMGLTTSVSMLLGALPVRAFTSAPVNYTGDTDRIVVLIRLAGGNDGLNTIVPLFDYGRYQSLRPTLAIPMSELIELESGYGIPSFAQGMEKMWQDGAMKIIQGVGYPEQNLSHFRSTDIWTSASHAQEELSSGWLGRLITIDDPDIVSDPPEFPPAIQIGNSGNLTFNNADGMNLSFTVSNTEQLFRIAEQGSLYPTEGLSDCLHDQQVDFVRQLANSTFRYSDTIQQAYENVNNQVEYTPSSLADQLAIVARLIKGGLQTSFYLVTLNGFDTHANQANAHEGLIRVLSENVSEFFQDLRAGQADQRVLAMTMSEFGRRPMQNASRGTDHGAAAPLFMFGPALEGNGFIGTHPDLYDFDNANNMKYTTDFRSVYHSILADWMCFPPEEVDILLGGAFSPLPLGINCQSVHTRIPTIENNRIEMATLSGRLHHFSFTLRERSQVQIELIDLKGRTIAKIHRGSLAHGPHTIPIPADHYQLLPGLYVFVIRTGKQVSSKKFVVY